ncbi:MAG: PRC-barrel domain-containing protein [Gammaproteobacteria bacterium]
MTVRVTALKGSRVRASDGEIGKVTDVYFDDEDWVVRYLVVDTGDWLIGRRGADLPPTP